MSRDGRKARVYSAYGYEFTARQMAEALGKDYSYICTTMRKYNGDSERACVKLGIKSEADMREALGRVTIGEQVTTEKAVDMVMEAIYGERKADQDIEDVHAENQSDGEFAEHAEGVPEVHHEVMELQFEEVPVTADIGPEDVELEQAPERESDERMALIAMNELIGSIKKYLIFGEDDAMVGTLESTLTQLENHRMLRFMEYVNWAKVAEGME